MEGELLRPRIDDVALATERTSAPSFLGFLTPNEAAVAQTVLKNRCRFEFFGGFSGAERTFLCCFPDWCEAVQYPISAFTLSFRECDVLTHRDFLGALMGLGITRESVGDILVESGRAVIFVNRKVAEFVKTQLEKVGNVGVRVSEGFSEPLPQNGKRIECISTVASARLNCVVSALSGVSRAKACELIEQGDVSINSVAVQKSVKTVCEGDRITVRKKGRFDVTEISATTKKGRIVLKYTKFI